MITEDPWLTATKAETRVANMRYRHKVALTKLRDRHATEMEALQLDLMHLEIDIAAGRPNAKLIETLRAIRKRLK